MTDLTTPAPGAPLVSGSSPSAVLVLEERQRGGGQRVTRCTFPECLGR